MFIVEKELAHLKRAHAMGTNKNQLLTAVFGYGIDVKRRHRIVGSTCNAVTHQFMMFAYIDQLGFVLVNPSLNRLGIDLNYLCYDLSSCPMIS